MPTPASRHRATHPAGPTGRRPTHKQLREAASQLAEEGQLLWLVGQGLHHVLTVAESPTQYDSLVEALRGWAGRAVRAATVVRREALPTPMPGADRLDPVTSPARLAGAHRVPAETEGEGEAAQAGMPVAWISSQTVRGSWVTLAVGVDRQGNKKALSLQEGSTSDPVVVRRVVEEMAAHVDPLAGLLLITDGSRPLEDVAVRQWDGAVLIGHCHLSLRHELLAHLPKDQRLEFAESLELAWRQPSGEAATSLRSLASGLKKRHPGAAERLERSLEASLRVAGLGVRPPLRQHLESTGVVRMAIEKALRWGQSTAQGVAAVAAGLPIWQRRTKRLIGYRALAALAKTLQDNLAATP